MCCTKDWPFTYNQIILLSLVSESLSPVPRSTWLGGWKQRFQLLLLFEQLLNHPCLKKKNVKLWFAICTFDSNHPCLKKIDVKLWSLICTLYCCQLLQKLQVKQIIESPPTSCWLWQKIKYSPVPGIWERSAEISRMWSVNPLPQPPYSMGPACMFDQINTFEI